MCDGTGYWWACLSHTLQLAIGAYQCTYVMGRDIGGHVLAVGACILPVSYVAVCVRVMGGGGGGGGLL